MGGRRWSSWVKHFLFITIISRTMSGKGNHGYGSNGYTVSSSGTNSQVISLPGFPLGKQFTDRRITPNTSQGNHYCHRDSDSGSSGYHYSNSYVAFSFCGALVSFRPALQKRQLLLFQP